MVAAPGPGSGPPLPPPDQNRHHWWRRLAVAGGCLLIGGVVASWAGFRHLQSQTLPFFEENLSDALGRPISLGRLERVSLTGATFSDIILPPTPDNFSWARVGFLDVRFNPLELVLTRTLRPTLVLVKPDVVIRQRYDGRWLVQAPAGEEEEGIIATELQGILIQRGQIAVGPIARSRIVQAPQGFSSSELLLIQEAYFKTTFEGSETQPLLAFKAGGQIQRGTVQLEGELKPDSQDLNLSVRANALPLSEFNPFLGGSLFIGQESRGSAQLLAELRPQQEPRLSVWGTARLQEGAVFITELDRPIADVDAVIRFKEQRVTVDRAELSYGAIPVEARGSVEPKEGYDLAVSIPALDLQGAADTLAVELPVEASGTFQVATQLTGPIDQPVVQGTVENLGNIVVDRLGLDTVRTQFSLSRDRFGLDELLLLPQVGGIVTASGEADIQDINQPLLDIDFQTELPLDAIANLYGISTDLESYLGVGLPVDFVSSLYASQDAFTNISLGTLTSNGQLLGSPVNPQASARWQLSQGSFLGAGEITFNDNNLNLQNSQLRIGEGVIDLDATADFDQRDWQATIAALQIPLGQLLPVLRGQLDANVQVAGNVDNLNLTGTRAEGRLTLSETIPLNVEGASEILPGPLTTDFQWQGDGLRILQAVAPRLTVSGFAATRVNQDNFPEVTNLDFDVLLQDLDLAAATRGGQQLGLLPDLIQLTGRADFDGRLSGSPATPGLAGTLGLRGLAVNQFAFVSDLIGPMQFAPGQGASLNLTGEQAQLAANLDERFLPQSFSLQNGEVTATGRRQGDTLAATVRNFPIDALEIAPVADLDLGVLGGTLNADLTANLADLNNLSLEGEIDIDGPSLGYIAADRFAGRFRLGNGVALLTDGQLQVGQSQFLITASGTQSPELSFSSHIAIAQGNLQDVFTALQYLELEDFQRAFGEAPVYGTAADLVTVPLGDPLAPLMEQIEQVLAAADVQQEQEEKEDWLPDLAALDAPFAGQLDVTFTASQGPTLAFDLTGENWHWGEYDFPNQFIARGGLNDDVLTLDPFEFSAGDTLLSLAGKIGGEGQSAQLEMLNISLEAVSSLLDLPIQLGGGLNAISTLSGDLGNPTLQGDIVVDTPLVNQNPLQEVSSTFAYEDARFTFAGRVQGDSPEALTATGDIPYALPWMTVQPNSDEIDITVGLKDDALALINVLAPYLAWGGGSADINIQVGGTLQNPFISGAATFNQAAIFSDWLQESLTDLTGEILLVDNTIQVDSLQGDLLAGQILLQGQLPFLESGIRDAFSPMTLSLDQLNLQIGDGEIQSHVDGQVIATGSVQDPQITGAIHLTDTQVNVGPRLIGIVNQALADPLVQELIESPPEAPGRLNNFAFIFDNPAQIKAPPLFRFDLIGQIVLDGPFSGFDDPPFNAIQPSGDLYVVDGWLNTVTTEFALVERHDNVISFTPETGFEPTLDLLFRTSLPLQRNLNVAAPSAGLPGEIPDLGELDGLDSFERIDIFATVAGPSSRLFENLTLSSIPPRSQDQLLSMVSGGYLADLGGGEPLLSILSNNFGATLNNWQDSVRDTLGVRRFRVGATTILPSDDLDTLGFGVGLSAEVTDTLFLSIVQVLNQSNPTQFEVEYRINDELGVRGATDFDDDQRFFLEYRHRF